MSACVVLAMLFCDTNATHWITVATFASYTKDNKRVRANNVLDVLSNIFFLERKVIVTRDKQSDTT